MQGFLDPTRERQSYSQVACLVAELCHLLYDQVHVPNFLARILVSPDDVTLSYG